MTPPAFNLSADSPIQREEGPQLRIPVLEQLAVGLGGLGSNGRTLTTDEMAIGREVFQTSVDFSQVRIVEADIAAAPTTLGNNIRVSPGYTMDNGTLVHELTHVWQYQNRGTGYISNSATHQIGAMIAGGDRNGAYDAVVVPGRSFHHYSAEHQAVIVERWYNNPSLRADPVYQALIAEVRGATPMSAMDRYMESMYGTTGRDRRPDLFGDPMGRDDRPGTIPIFRLEF